MEGTPFGRYRLVELLGRGGMGEVWRAVDTATSDRMVAIKLLPPHLAADTTFAQRFRREADAAARLNNPHIIPIHNYGEIDGRLYVDMRLIEGGDLEELLADGPLDPGRAVRIIEQVAKALHTAHKVGLIHRDVKPSNILLDEDDFAYLIDFGIARGADQTALTSTGSVIGTWHYMAPERLGANEVDARSDIYALACVLYECLTGTRPFPGDTLESQVAAHLTVPPPHPSTSHPYVPAQLDAVIDKGMAKKPDERYPTTVELARDALDAVTAPIPRRPVAPEAPHPPTERVPVRAPTARDKRPPQPPPGRAFGSAATRRVVEIPSTQRAQPPSYRPAPSKPASTEKAGRRRSTVAISILGAGLILIAVTFVLPASEASIGLIPGAILFVVGGVLWIRSRRPRRAQPPNFLAAPSRPAGTKRRRASAVAIAILLTGLVLVIGGLLLATWVAMLGILMVVGGLVYLIWRPEIQNRERG